MAVIKSFELTITVLLKGRIIQAFASLRGFNSNKASALRSMQRKGIKQSTGLFTYTNKGGKPKDPITEFIIHLQCHPRIIINL